MKKYLNILSLCAVSASLVACANQPKNIELNEQFWQDKNQSVGVAESTKPQAHLEKQGNQGLLDYAINNAMTSSFENHLHTMDMSWLESFKTAIADDLKQHNIKTETIQSPIDVNALSNSKQDNKKYAVKSYTPLKIKVDNDKLLVITLNKVGAVRSYCGFIPQGAPSALIDITGELVDLNNNEIYWRHHTHIETAINGEWDQPPHYYNFDIALKTSVDTARDELRSSLLNNA